MMKIAITGTDTTGKSTLMSLLKQKASARASFLTYPEFYRNPSLPFADTSRALCRLMEVADQKSLPGVKAFGLFLSMVLFSFYERYLSDHDQLLITERQPLMDSLVYGQFYQKFLVQSLGQANLEEQICQVIGSSGRNVILSDLLHFTTPTSPLRRMTDISQIAALASKTFVACPKDLPRKLQRVYGATFCDHLIILTAHAETIRRRLDQRKEVKARSEIHERADYLVQFQSTYLAIARSLTNDGIPWRVSIISTDSATPESISSRLSETIFADAIPNKGTLCDHCSDLG